VIEEYRAGFEKVDAFELASHGLVVRAMKAFCSRSVARAGSLRGRGGGAGAALGGWCASRITGIVQHQAAAARAGAEDLSRSARPAVARAHGDLGCLDDCGQLGWHHADRASPRFRAQARRAEHRIYNLTGRAPRQPDDGGRGRCCRPRSTIRTSRQAPRKGAPLGWFAPGPVPVTDSGVAIARKAPHRTPRCCLWTF